MITDHATLLCYSVYVMACTPCKSPDQRVFTAEMNIHFPGRENLDKPTVRGFPLVTVCVNCGCGEFMVHDELLQLKENAEAEFVPCSSCQSENQKTLTSEMAIHFRGIEGLNEPSVLAFPGLSVCLDCGIAQFNAPEKELEVLRTGAPVEGAAVWLGGREDK